MNTLLGWTFEQWAVAAGESHPAWPYMPTLNGARGLQHDWKMRHAEDPAKSWLILSEAGLPIERLTDFDWAKKMFLSAITEIGPYGLRR